MSRSHFEQLVEGEMTKIKDAVMGINPTDGGIALAKFQGKHEGLKQAVDLYRQAARIDTEESL
jgi:hypothetical protein